MPRPIKTAMTRAEVRAYAIRWLAGKLGGMPRVYRGLDVRRVHFECGCSITKPGVRSSWGKPGPGLGPSKICAAHERALGGGCL